MTFARAATPRSLRGPRSFDGTTASSPQRAVAYGDIPTSAVWLRRRTYGTWHAAQRPADLTPGGVARRHPRASLGRRSVRSASMFPPVWCRRSSMSGCRPRSRASSESWSARRPTVRPRSRPLARAPRHRRGLGNRRRASHRGDGLRHRIDRARRQDLRSRRWGGEHGQTARES